MQILLDYRALHRIPELGRNLPMTLAYLKKALEGLPCRVFSPMEGALCAFFDFGAPGTLAVRADMDGLPIREETGLPWASRQEGAMHACGHDGHMAMVLDLARRLSREGLPKNNILLVFQPAEESGGGARDLCRTGVFRAFRVGAILGLHLWPGLPKGQIFSRPGPMMAAAREVCVQFFGPGGHIAQAGPDALQAAAAFYRRAYLRKPDRFLAFGVLRAGTACNARAGYANLRGTLRACREGDLARLEKRLQKAVPRSECRAKIDLSPAYAPVINHRGVLKTAAAMEPIRLLSRPLLTAEDFGFYQKLLPGAFFLLGTGAGTSLHSPRFSFDETILPQGAAFLQRLALGWPVIPIRKRRCTAGSRCPAGR